MAAAVIKDPLAIGYVSFAFSEALKRLDLTNECGITASATPFAIKSEEYPLGRRLYFYNRADNTPDDAKRFLDYVMSPQADDVIAKSGFVNFAVERAPLDPARYSSLYAGRSADSMEPLADQLITDLTQWERFSTTLRFRPGSFILDRNEVDDINRLVNTLSELPEGTQVAAVGITDNLGKFDDNLRLSRLRTQTVADAINSTVRDRKFKVQIDTRYFSQMLPTACNSGDANGSANNRRVEIWIRK